MHLYLFDVVFLHCLAIHCIHLAKTKTASVMTVRNPFIPVLPTLHVPPNISFADDNRMELEFEFEAWTESVGVGDTPTSYKIQIEESGIWIDLSLISTPNNVTMVHRLPSGVEPGNTYLVRIIPQLKHEGRVHDGEGVYINLTVPAKPTTAPKGKFYLFSTLSILFGPQCFGE